MMWPELKAFEDFEEKYRGGELKWRYDYEQRALKMQEEWRGAGSRVFELVPPNNIGPRGEAFVEKKG